MAALSRRPARASPVALHRARLACGRVRHSTADRASPSSQVQRAVGDDRSRRPRGPRRARRCSAAMKATRTSRRFARSLAEHEHAGAVAVALDDGGDRHVGQRRRLARARAATARPCATRPLASASCGDSSRTSTGNRPVRSSAAREISTDRAGQHAARDRRPCGPRAGSPSFSCTISRSASASAHDVAAVALAEHQHRRAGRAPARAPRPACAAPRRRAAR